MLTVIQILFSVTLLLILALTAAFLTRKCSASLRHRIWSSTLLGTLLIPLIVPFVPQFLLSGYRCALPILEDTQIGQEETSVVIPVIPSNHFEMPQNNWDVSYRDRNIDRNIDRDFAGNLNENLNRNIDGDIDRNITRQPVITAVTVPAPTSAADIKPIKPRSVTVTNTLFVIWIIGSTFCLLRFMMSLVSATKLRNRLAPLDEPMMLQIIESIAQRLHIKRPVKLLRSEFGSVPFTIGVLSPAVVVPLESKNWSADQCRAVLTHELAHVSRNDIMRQYLAQLAVAVYWFHPLVWFAAWKIRVERELACDDLVLLEGERPCDYADVLFHLAANLKGRNRRYILGCAVAMARRSGVAQRIAAILNPKIRRSPLGRFGSAVAVLVAVCGIAVAALLSPVETQQKQNETQSNTENKQESNPQVSANAPTETSPAPAQNNPSQVTPTFALKIIDADGKPIDGATGHYSRVDKDNKRIWRHFTAKNGEVNLELAAKENAKHFSFSIKTNGFTPFYGDFSDDDKSSFTVKLDKAETIGGIVVDENGKPVAGVEVNFSFPYGKYSYKDDRIGCSASGKTDAEGRWTCGYVPFDVIGIMRFSLIHPDYQATQISVDVGGLLPDSSGQFSKVLTIESGLQLTGNVTDSNGKAIADARVEIQFFGIPGSEKDVYRRTKTDTAGNFRFVGCPAIERAAVVATAPGFAGQFIETAISTETKSVDLKLEPAKPLKLYIVDQAGKPVTKPVVSIAEWGPFLRQSMVPITSRMLNADNYEPIKLDDGQGNWTWNDAIAGSFNVTIYADGFMLQDVAVKSGNETQTITMIPELNITGNVLDDVSGQPVGKFTVTEGMIFDYPYIHNPNKQVSWQPQRREEANGQFNRRYTIPYSEQRLRVEAEGYEPCESRAIQNNEGKITLEFRLKKAAAVVSVVVNEVVRRGSVLTPNGSPAANATLVYATSGPRGGIGISLSYTDGFKHRSTVADKEGKFTLPKIELDPQINETYAFIVIHETGFLRVEQADFEKTYNIVTNPNAAPIKLERWAEIEGTLFIGSKAGQGMEIFLNSVDKVSDPKIPRIDVYENSILTDVNGKFAIRKVAPGNYSLSRQKNVPTGGGMSMSFPLYAIPVSVKAGEKQTVVLGGTGRPVIGRATTTPELEEVLLNGQQRVVIRTTYPAMQEPKFPLEIQADIDKMRNEIKNAKDDSERQKIGEYQKSWLTTENGKKYVAIADEFNEKNTQSRREWEKKNAEIMSRSYSGVINKDGTFRVDDVPAGDWIYQISLHSGDDFRNVADTGPQKFTIPVIPGGQSDEPLDLGTVIVKNNSPQVSANAPTETSSAPAPSNTLLLSIVDPNGKPIPNVEVEVRMNPSPKEPKDWTTKPELFVSKKRSGVLLKTDNDGKVPVRLSGKPVNNIDCFVQIDHFTPFVARWGHGGPEPVPAEYTIHLDAAATVGAQFVNQKGEPVEGVEIHPSVEYKKRDDDKSQLGTGGLFKSDKDGNWVFHNVPTIDERKELQKNFYIEVSHPQYVPLWTNLPLDEYTVDQNGKPVQKIVLDSGYTVSGTVRDADGNPMKDATVRATFINIDRETKTDENGVYHLTTCPPGKHRLFVTAKNYAPGLREVKIGHAVGRIWDNKYKVDPATEGDVSEIDFNLSLGNTIKVRVNDKDGKPMPGAGIFFQSWRGTNSDSAECFGLNFDCGCSADAVCMSTETDEKGFWVWHEAPPDGITVDVCPRNRMQIASQRLIPRAEEYVFTATALLTITGTVIDAETKQPIQKMTVTPAFFNEGQKHPSLNKRETYVSVDGKYKFQTHRADPPVGFQIAAEGYEPVLSIPYKGDEETQTANFELKKKSPIPPVMFDDKAAQKDFEGLDVVTAIASSPANNDVTEEKAKTLLAELKKEDEASKWWEETKDLSKEKKIKYIDNKIAEVKRILALKLDKKTRNQTETTFAFWTRQVAYTDTVEGIKRFRDFAESIRKNSPNSRYANSSIREIAFFQARDIFLTPDADYQTALLQLKAALKSEFATNPALAAYRTFGLLDCLKYAGDTAVDLEELRKYWEPTLQEFLPYLKKVNGNLVQSEVDILEGGQRFKNLTGKKIDLEGILIDGQKFDWSSYRDHPVLFYTTDASGDTEEYCSMAYFTEAFQRVDAKYKDKGLRFIGYSMYLSKRTDNDTDEEILEAMKKAKLPGVMMSGSQSVTAGYKSMNVYYGCSFSPCVLFIDKDGTVLSTRVGHVHENFANEKGEVELDWVLREYFERQAKAEKHNSP